MPGGQFTLPVAAGFKSDPRRRTIIKNVTQVPVQRAQATAVRLAARGGRAIGKESRGRELMRKDVLTDFNVLWCAGDRHGHHRACAILFEEWRQWFEKDCFEAGGRMRNI
jgi:hypothetical protein